MEALEPKPYVRNAADSSQVNEADGKAKRGRERELNDVKFLLSTAEGRRFLWRYLGVCRLYETSFELSAKIHYNEGIRSIGLKLMADIVEADPMAYVEMMKSAAAESKKTK